MLQDLRFALRHLLRSPGATLTALFVLVLGLTASTTAFTYLRSYQQPFPGADASGLVQLFQTRDGNSYGELSYPDYLDLVGAETSAFEGFTADNSGFAASVRFEAGTEVAYGQAVTGGFFSLLGVEMAHGRPLTEEDDHPEAEPTVVLSHEYWRREFGGDPSVLGRTLFLNNNPYTMVGVVGPAFKGSSASTQPDIWIPHAEYRRVYWARDGRRENRELGVMRTFARLREGSTLARAQAELTGFAAGLDAQAPLESGERHFHGAPATWIHPRAREAEAPVNRAMLAAALGLLLLACANVANLLLSKAARRRQEMAIVAAQGATPWRLARQLLAENVVLAFLAGALALLLAGPASTRLGSYFDRPSVWGAAVPREMSVDLEVFFFAFAASVLTGIVVGLLPALRMARGDLASSLKEGAGTSRLRRASRRRRALGARDLLVSVQVAISVVLLVICGLVLRTLDSVQSIDPGFDTETLLASYMSTSSTGLPIEERERFYRELAEHMEELPWVRAATVAAQAPLAGHPMEEFRPDAGTEPTAVTVARVVPGFFEKVGIPLRQGRLFEPFDDPEAPLVVILNETAARLYFEDGNAVGRRVLQESGGGDPPGSFEVVGVVGDARVTSLLGDPEPVLYLCYPQHYYTPGNALIISASGDPGAAANLFQQELRAVDPLLALVNALPYSEVVAGFTYPQRKNVELFTLLALSGLFLAAVGIFAVLSLAVGERTREIGIRLAIGAPWLHIVRTVAGRAALAVGLGTVAGLGLSVAAQSLVQGLLIGVEAVDPPSIALGTLVLVAAATLATWIPTLRALRVDAATSLRAER